MYELGVRVQCEGRLVYDKSWTDLSRYEWLDRLFHTSHPPSFLGGFGDLALLPKWGNRGPERERGGPGRALTLTLLFPAAPTPHPESSLFFFFNLFTVHYN